MTPLFEPRTFVAFMLAASALVAAPGPGQALVLTRTFQGGARDGILTAAGLELGTLIHTVAAALGLSAILATSALAFDLVKYLGAGYLIVLGISAWRRTEAAPAGALAVAPAALPGRSSRLLLHAAVTGTLNPKVALFFLAFLPQFIDPARGRVVLQFGGLGLTFAVLGLMGDSAVALIGHGARERLLRAPGWAVWRERVTGTILVGLGARLLFLSRR